MDTVTTTSPKIIKQLLIGASIAIVVNAIYIGGYTLLEDYKSYRKALGVLQYKAYVMQNAESIESYDTIQQGIIDEHKDHFFCSRHMRSEGLLK